MTEVEDTAAGAAGEQPKKRSSRRKSPMQRLVLGGSISKKLGSDDRNHSSSSLRPRAAAQQQQRSRRGKISGSRGRQSGGERMYQGRTTNLQQQQQQTPNHSSRYSKQQQNQSSQSSLQPYHHQTAPWAEMKDQARTHSQYGVAHIRRSIRRSFSKKKKEGRLDGLGLDREEGLKVGNGERRTVNDEEDGYPKMNHNSNSSAQKTRQKTNEKIEQQQRDSKSIANSSKNDVTIAAAATRKPTPTTDEIQIVDSSTTMPKQKQKHMSKSNMLRSASNDKKLTPEPRSRTTKTTSSSNNTSTKVVVEAEALGSTPNEQPPSVGGARSAGASLPNKASGANVARNTGVIDVSPARNKPSPAIGSGAGTNSLSEQPHHQHQPEENFRSSFGLYQESCPQNEYTIGNNLHLRHSTGSNNSRTGRIGQGGERQQRRISRGGTLHDSMLRSSARENLGDFGSFQEEEAGPSLLPNRSVSCDNFLNTSSDHQNVIGQSRKIMGQSNMEEQQHQLLQQQQQRKIFIISTTVNDDNDTVIENIMDSTGHTMPTMQTTRRLSIDGLLQNMTTATASIHPRRLSYDSLPLECNSNTILTRRHPSPILSRRRSCDDFGSHGTTLRRSKSYDLINIDDVWGWDSSDGEVEDDDNDDDFLNVVEKMEEKMPTSATTITGVQWSKNDAPNKSRENETGSSTFAALLTAVNGRSAEIEHAREVNSTWLDDLQDTSSARRMPASRSNKEGTTAAIMTMQVEDAVAVDNDHSEHSTVNSKDSWRKNRSRPSRSTGIPKRARSTGALSSLNKKGADSAYDDDITFERKRMSAAEKNVRQRTISTMDDEEEEEEDVGENSTINSKDSYSRKSGNTRSSKNSKISLSSNHAHSLQDEDEPVSWGKKYGVQAPPWLMYMICLCYCVSLVFVGILGFGIHYLLFRNSSSAGTNNHGKTSPETYPVMTPSFRPSTNDMSNTGSDGSYMVTKLSPSTLDPSASPTDTIHPRPSADPSLMPLPPSFPSNFPSLNPSSSPTLSMPPSTEPSNFPSFSPTATPQCPEQLLKSVTLRDDNDDNLLTMKYDVVIYQGINNDGLGLGGLLCITLEYAGVAGWIGLAFSEAKRDPQYGRKEAVIGIPGMQTSVAVASTEGSSTSHLGQQNVPLQGGEGLEPPAFANPGKYEIPAGGVENGFYGPSLSLLGGIDKQTLLNGSVLMEPHYYADDDGISYTRMSFVKYLREPDEIEIKPYEPTLLLYAVSPLDTNGEFYDGNPQWKYTYLNLLEESSDDVFKHGLVRKRKRQHEMHT